MKSKLDKRLKRRKFSSPQEREAFIQGYKDGFFDRPAKPPVNLVNNYSQGYDWGMKDAVDG